MLLGADQSPKTPKGLAFFGLTLRKHIGLSERNPRCIASTVISKASTKSSGYSQCPEPTSGVSRFTDGSKAAGTACRGPAHTELRKAYRSVRLA